MSSAVNTGDALRQAMAKARLRDVDVATALKVDPKTVQRWLSGRLPQTRHRWALADLLDAGELDLWPRAAGSSSLSPELIATYDYRSAVPREVWVRLFEDAQRDIGILVYSGLFIAEDIGILKLLERKAAEGVSVRILLGDPSSPQVADRGREEGIGHAMEAKIRNAIVHYQPLMAVAGVEIRLHPTVLYNSLYRADDDLLVNQHVFGTAAAHSPVLHLRGTTDSALLTTHLASFEQIWSSATPLGQLTG